MIKHHPKFELIQAYVNGELPASLSAGITIHAEMCPKCQQTIAQLTEQVAEMAFEVADIESNTEEITVDNKDDNIDFDFEAMMNDITSEASCELVTPVINKTLSFKNMEYTLPSVLSNITLGRMSQIGKLTRSRLQLDEDEIHTNLLHISPGGGVPEHTHKGFELTVLLDGTFSDEQGDYVKGDFIMLDASNKHHPFSAEGCLCYTVANDALHFTQGINKLLNPIGSFIY